jgi:hypothetical protein
MRSNSAPPICLNEAGHLYFLRENEPSDLFMDCAYLHKFSSVTTIVKTHARAVMTVDDNKILKLYPCLVDVSVIVTNMNLARAKIPVPRVHDYGYSGNCAYILMERVMDTMTGQEYIDFMKCSVPRRLSCRVKEIVADLASVGLSHNDLYPRNLMVDRFWEIKSVIDWDDCTKIELEGEYARRVLSMREMHDWNHFFLKYSLDRSGEILLSDSGGIYCRPPFSRYPLSRKVSPVDRGIKAGEAEST